MTHTLSGKELAAEIRSKVTVGAATLRASGVVPTLAIAVATDDGATAWYVNSIEKAAKKVGLDTRLVQLPATSDLGEMTTALTDLAGDRAVHGIIVQTPLPAGVTLANLAPLVPYEKDIDGVNPLSAGRIMLGEPAFAPATAAAVMALLRHHEIPLAGRRVVVVGRSAVVGKPVAHLLLQENATVTICHSRTADLPSVTREADVLVVAIGRTRFITSQFVKPGATVIDVGTNAAADGSLLGDVDAADVSGTAGALTPVPGGVGPVTTALLLQHAIAAATPAP